MSFKTFDDWIIENMEDDFELDLNIELEEKIYEEKNGPKQCKRFLNQFDINFGVIALVCGNCRTPIAHKENIKTYIVDNDGNHIAYAVTKDDLVNIFY